MEIKNGKYLIDGLFFYFDGSCLEGDNKFTYICSVIFASTFLILKISFSGHKLMSHSNHAIQ